MSRIQPVMTALLAQNRKALIPYVTAGFPFADITPALMHGMVAGGADVIELGVPFSDPSADGPVIQKAGDRALAFGVGLVQVLGMVRGVTVRSRSVIGNIGGSIQSIFGGNLSIYTKLADDARAEAYLLLVQHARETGANAILAMRYDANEIMEGITEVLAYGTAVRVEPA